MGYVLQDVRSSLIEILVRELAPQGDEASYREQLGDALGYQEQPDFGELSLTSFKLMDLYGDMDPKNITAMVASNLQDRLPPHVRLDKKGPFLNFHIAPEHFADQVLKCVFNGGAMYGHQPQREEPLTIVEFSSPNYGKELHVGHIRSALVGNALVRLLRASGCPVFAINYPGDIGEHMGKVLFGLRKWSESTLPDDPLQAQSVMSEVYAHFESEKTDASEKEAHRLNLAVEQGDAQAVSLWERVCSLSRAAHALTYDRLNIVFDETQLASTALSRGKQLVEDALNRKVASYYEGSVSITLTLKDKKSQKERHGFLKIRNPEGGSVYGTLDMGIAVMRSEQLSFGRMVYVVGNEQSDYFVRLFAALHTMGYSFAEHCKHLPTGHLTLPEGKMSSRGGNVILLEDVLNGAVDNARQVLTERQFEGDIGATAESIGLGALKYFILSKDPTTTFVYDEQRVFNLEGKSAPFAQYAYARAGSILQKVNAADPASINYNSSSYNTPAERLLLRQIAHFPVVVDSAASTLRPHLMTEYVHELASVFNTFYKECPVMREEDQVVKNSRLALVHAFRQTMSNALGLLGIQVPEKM